MSSLTKASLITALEKLGKWLDPKAAWAEKAISSAQRHNAWFTEAEIKKAIDAWHDALSAASLEQWFANIEIRTQPKKVGLILAGNIPFVGLHDIISVLATGNIALIKLSSSDDKLLPLLLQQLTEFEPALAAHIQFVERLTDFDAVIATGSNNSSRYFDYYFGKVPHIIRKNRNSVAVLTGRESKAELENLGRDIFDYFGLGCRNVAKLFVPKDYHFTTFFEAIEPYQPIIHHFKYNNNYDYNKSIYLVNGVPHLDNGFLLVKQDEGLASPLAVLYYEEYGTLQEIEEKIKQSSEQIQCVVAAKPLEINTGTIAFGQSQHPNLWDYADDINTIDFLQAL
ncbi:MAG: acyl-CoA reductase [Pedobacter sp.]|nr:acyl-CoA reductase [Pedobacter sp.]MDQ8053361.1 acyl-CoA reductase [Pedobacter sp.]